MNQILPVQIRICTEMSARTLPMERYVARVIRVIEGDEGARQTWFGRWQVSALVRC
jgi:hypothetical protein